MARLKKSQYKAPFWGKADNYVSGLDQLGMQRTSIATYQKLLPGLTNLTQRIRYYSFYSWLINLFEEHFEKVSEIKDEKFLEFMRRGELLFAYVNVMFAPEEKGIVGSDFVKRELKKSPTSIDVETGAELYSKSTEKVYWKHRLGAFGQYYSGVLVSLGLIKRYEDSSIVYKCRNNGKKLAKLFDMQVSDKSKKIFYSTIINGNISTKDIGAISNDFQISGIVKGSEEAEFLVDLIFTKGEKYRLPSTLQFLDFYHRGTADLNEHAMSTFLYKSKGMTNLAPDLLVAKCWYYYQLNEYAHYAMEALLWVVLSQLQGNILLTELLSKILDLLENDVKISKALDTSFGEYASTSSDDRGEISNLVDGIHEYTLNSKKSPSKVLIYSLRTLAFLYKNDFNNSAELRTIAINEGICQNGEVTELLLWMNNSKEKSLRQFVNDLILEEVVNRHIYEAMRKLRNTSQNTLKFQIIDGYVEFIRMSEPVWTGPRLSTLKKMMIDLSLFTKDGKVTDSGVSLLKEKSTWLRS